MRRELPLNPSAIIFGNVFSFSKELDPEALKMCIFLGKDCEEKQFVKDSLSTSLKWQALDISQSAIPELSCSHHMELH